jgi:toxin YoeB
MIFRYSKQAQRDLLAWKKSGQKGILEKIKAIQDEIEKAPSATVGKYRPEQLRHEFAGWYSREITKKDRIVYRPHPDEQGIIEIIQCRGHYSDT